MKFVHRRMPMVFLALALCAGCATAPGADPIVVRAEQTWRIGFDVVDSFVILERQGAVAMLKKPAIHDFAEKLRAAAPDGSKLPGGLAKPYGRWVFDQLDAAILAYKTNRNSQSKADLSTYLATAESLIHSASEAMKGSTP